MSDISQENTPPEKFDIKSITVTHDTFFTETFQTKRLAIAFLKVVLPKELVENLKLDELVVLPRHVTSSIFKGKVADVIYRVPVKKSVAKGVPHVDFFAVLEHKSNTDFLTIFQLWSYVQRLCEMNLTEAKAAKKKFNAKNYRFPPVVPVIVHHGESIFTGQTELFELFAKLPGTETYLPRLRAILFDLSRFDDADVPSDPEVPELRWILMILKAIFSPEIGKTLKSVAESLKPYS
ncbi:MAG: Rpn family recombination-promoting nuclease/putative transposase, partial [Thermoguttaceae bacterium]